MRFFLLIWIPVSVFAQTPSQRLVWFGNVSAGPAGLAGGLAGAGFGTLFDSPREYDTHWRGFGQRYGMRLTGLVTANAIEAGVGALWGEDPRYPRAAGSPFGARIRNIVRMTFQAGNAHGERMPAYARYAAMTGSSFLSNTWRPSSEAGARHAVTRIGLGFLARMASNAFAEFWPDIKRRTFRRTPASPGWTDTSSAGEPAGSSRP